MSTYILSIAMVVTTIWIVKRFWGSFFEKRRTTALSCIVWVLFGGFQLLSLYDIGNINTIITIINLLFIILIATCGYQCEKKSKYFLSVLFCTVWALIELFVFFLLSYIQMEHKKLLIMGTVISTLFMIIFVYIISVVWDKKNSEIIPTSYYFYLLFIPVGSIYIAINQFYSQNSELISTLAISVLLFFNIIFLDIYAKMNILFSYEREKAVYAQQLKVISESTIEQKKIMEEFHEEKHNLLNELIALQGEIEENGSSTFFNTLNKIINNYNNLGKIYTSGNATVDAILNFKYSIAREYEINFQLNIFIPEKLPIDQSDMGVVLGNALDNAIEAVKECESSERAIKISMGVKKEACIISIRNPYKHEIKRNKYGEIITSKKDIHRHGFGLKSIKRIAENYYGDVMIDTNNNIFSLTIVLNFKEF